MLAKSQKDIDITTTAFLKSIIESGADPSDWEELTKKALRLHHALVTTQLKNMAAKQTTGPAARKDTNGSSRKQSLATGKQMV